MIYPSDLPKPYTDLVHVEHNIKPREVLCRFCHYTLVTNLISPRCGKCHHYLITVIKHDIVAR